MDYNPLFENLALRMKAISDSTRLKILAMLMEGEQSSGDILKKLDIAQPTFSHHMKILTGIGLVDSRKEGVRCIYSLNITTLHSMAHLLEQMARYAENIK